MSGRVPPRAGRLLARAAGVGACAAAAVFLVAQALSPRWESVARLELPSPDERLGAQRYRSMLVLAATELARPDYAAAVARAALDKGAVGQEDARIFLARYWVRARLEEGALEFVARAGSPEAASELATLAARLYVPYACVRDAEGDAALPENRLPLSLQGSPAQVWPRPRLWAVLAGCQAAALILLLGFLRPWLPRRAA